MQEKIWNVASSDSINIKEFYQSNKSKYSSFDDSRGEIISDYQDFLENNWIDELRENNNVIILFLPEGIDVTSCMSYNNYSKKE